MAARSAAATSLVSRLLGAARTLVDARMAVTRRLMMEVFILRVGLSVRNATESEDRRRKCGSGEEAVAVVIVLDDASRKFEGKRNCLYSSLLPKFGTAIQHI